MTRLYEEDTIAAISTAVSESGIGIIRISGTDAVNIADKVFCSPGGKKKLADVPSHTIHYGYAIFQDQVLDEVLVSVMRAPRTYTAEDIVEFNCHGGVLVLRSVLEAIWKQGARPAEPGEFTKRAFLNGRIDLTQAEAVMDVIRARNNLALENSVRQIRGSLQQRIEKLRKEILYQSAHIEACLDDPEALSYEDFLPELSDACGRWIRSLSDLLSTADAGRMMKEGIRTVIAGKPNAGKSSLLNLLLGEERAIVTPVAGTTRDVLTETITIGQITLLLTDTAGIRKTDDPVEQIGVRRAEKAMEEADLVLFLIDASTPVDENDRKIMRTIGDRKVIILQNKTDLPIVTDKEQIEQAFYSAGDTDIQKAVSEDTLKERIIPFSVKDRTGLDELKKKVKNMFFSGHISYNDEVIITNERQKRLLKKAQESLLQLQESIRNHMPEDFYTIDLMDAYRSLGEITGQETGEDLVDEIFSRFCMGK